MEVGPQPGRRSKKWINSADPIHGGSLYIGHARGNSRVAMLYTNPSTLDVPFQSINQPLGLAHVQELPLLPFTAHADHVDARDLALHLGGHLEPGGLTPERVICHGTCDDGSYGSLVHAIQEVHHPLASASILIQSPHRLLH